jgi:tRNA(Leu) C34 or U34 (ribose-2'-O)-methylase TrmL
MRGYSGIGLYMPKTEPNIGGALRAASCYGSSLVAVQGRRFKRMATDTLKTWRHIPLLLVDDLLSVIPYDCQPVCVELTDNAESLINFKHPHRAFYIFGAEDGGIPKILTNRFKTVQVPTLHCMNLASTVNVVLYDRLAKSL